MAPVLTRILQTNPKNPLVRLERLSGLKKVGPPRTAKTYAPTMLLDECETEFRRAAAESKRRRANQPVAPCGEALLWGPLQRSYNPRPEAVALRGHKNSRAGR
jgi:hypothetical protein